jgi:DNA polymerase elongation subunit (family B)
MTADSFTFALRSCVVFDLECYPGRWCVGFQGPGSNGAATFKCVENREDLTKLLAWFAAQGRILIGYNSSRFDVLLIRGILKGIDPYAPAQSIIREDKLPASLANLPEFLPNHIDLSARLRRGGSIPSLKVVAARLGRPTLRELPYPPDAILTDSQWEEVKRYNIVDLQHTWTLLERLEPELAALAALSGEQQQDLRSIPTPQIVERVFARAYRETHGRNPVSVKWSEIRYRPVQGVARPRTWDAADWFDRITSEPIPMVLQGSRKRADVPTVKFSIGGLKLSAGSGGLHSVDAPGVFYATRKQALLSVDVQSFYPSLIASKGIAPAAYGDAGRETYRSLLERRLAVKQAAKETTDPAERERLAVQADGLKLVLNSFFGKTGDPYSSLYDPSAFLAVTLSGQLMLIDLIERLTEAGVKVLSANTD